MGSPAPPLVAVLRSVPSSLTSAVVVMWEVELHYEAQVYRCECIFESSTNRKCDKCHQNPNSGHCKETALVVQNDKKSQ